jgi:nitroreductase
MKTIIDNLNWRYATKKFDSSKKVSNENLDTLLEVLRLTPSSYGLQPYMFLVIENKEIREKLKEKSGGQSQVTDASHLFVLCSYLDINDVHIDAHVANTANARGLEAEALKGFGDFMKKTINQLDAEKKQIWNSKQAYIALGQLMHACADLKIDATPMEGFDPAGYDEVLGLTAKNLHATLVCPIGYRSEEDANQHFKKVRKSREDLIEFIS